MAVLADRLSERLDTRVSVELGKRRGKVVIQFGSVDDLERIAGLLGVTAAGAGAEEHGHDHDGDQTESGHDHEHDGNEHGGYG